MTDSPQSGSNWTPEDFRTDVPHSARIYDYWLGGKDNFEADRNAAEFTLQLIPQMLDYARGNRQFMVRVVRFLVASGIRQFLDIGTGFPTSPNVHEIAQEASADSRVVYVDYDPMVVSHAQTLMATNPAVRVVKADLRDVDKVLGGAIELLDLSQPVALMFVACLHHLEDEDEPAGVVARYLPALAPGSFLVLSHLTSEFAPEAMRALHDEAKRRGGETILARPKEEIAAMFNGRELLDPGLVQVSYWRPDGEPGPNADRVWAYGGVAAV
jgi:S-adenosyl methyltransferase